MSYTRQLWLALLVACGGPAARDAGAAPATDAGPRDAGPGDADDAGRSDASAADSGGARDAAAPDAGDALGVCDVLGAFTPEALSPPGAGTDAYVSASATEIAAFGRALDAIAAGGAAADADLDDAGYRACRDSSGGGQLVALLPRDATIGAARVAVRLGDASPWIVGAPHPFFESGTLDEARAMLVDLSARALIVSGTHRCASLAPSACDGRTSVCGSMAPYRTSDAAHATDSFFHAAHDRLAAAFPTTVTLSLHGMSADGIIVSDGTTSPTSGTSLLARLAAQLSARFSDVASCSAGAGVPTATRLCGTTNAQGRGINGSTDACTNPAPASSGRFVHLEQSRAVRGAVSDVILALAAAQ